MASLIGWWPVPGTFQRTVVGAWSVASGATREGRRREVAGQAPDRRGAPVVVRQLSRKTAASWATIGPSTRHITS